MSKAKIMKIIEIIIGISLICWSIQLLSQALLPFLVIFGTICYFYYFFFYQRG